MKPQQIFGVILCFCNIFCLPKKFGGNFRVPNEKHPGPAPRLRRVDDGMERQRLQILAALEDVPEGSREGMAALGRVYMTFVLAEPGVFRPMFALSGERENDLALMENGEEVFGLVKHDVARCMGEVEDGLSFLTIDGKVAKMRGDFEIEPLPGDIARRVLAA